jgi:hypothetical protein
MTESLTISQAAERKCVSVVTLAKWLKHPKIVYRLASHLCECGAHLLIKVSDLDAYEAQSRGRPAKTE